MSYFKLKRDITTNNDPSADQVEIGELVINATTGILYTKLTNGSLVKFNSSPITNPNNPTIDFVIASNFCCDNDSITVNVGNLIVGGDYEYEFSELGNNGLVLSPSSQTSGQITPTDSSNRSITILAQKTGDKTVALVKFKVKQAGVTVAEEVGTINCGTCVTDTQQ